LAYALRLNQLSTLIPVNPSKFLKTSKVDPRRLDRAVARQERRARAAAVKTTARAHKGPLVAAVKNAQRFFDA
jgi:predicted TIM-barrel fold metal-dependent hydrolase